MLLTRKATSDAAEQSRAFNSRLSRGLSGVLAKTMDRRTFLKRSGVGVGAGAVATQLPFNIIERAEAKNGPGIRRDLQEAARYPQGKRARRAVHRRLVQAQQ